MKYFIATLVHALFVTASASFAGWLIGNFIVQLIKGNEGARVIAGSMAFAIISFGALWLWTWALDVRQRNER